MQHKMDPTHDDEFFVEEVLRLLGENGRLRQKAQRLGADMCQLELQLDGLSSVELEGEAQEAQSYKATPLECCDSMYPVSLLKLINENSFLRSQIQLAEVELMQLELAVQSRIHLEDSDSDCEDLEFDSWNARRGGSCGPLFPPAKTSLNLSKLDARSETSSESASPKIKAFHCDTDEAMTDRSKAESSIPPKSFRRSRNRTLSSVSMHIERTRRSTARKNAAGSVGPWERSMRSSKGLSFMSGKKAVAVDSASSAFFASLRS